MIPCIGHGEGVIVLQRRAVIFRRAEHIQILQFQGSPCSIQSFFVPKLLAFIFLIILCSFLVSLTCSSACYGSLSFHRALSGIPNITLTTQDDTTPACRMCHRFSHVFPSLDKVVTCDGGDFFQRYVYYQCPLLSGTVGTGQTRFYVARGAPYESKHVLYSSRSYSALEASLSYGQDRMKWLQACR